MMPTSQTTTLHRHIMWKKKMQMNRYKQKFNQQSYPVQNFTQPMAIFI